MARAEFNWKNGLPIIQDHSKAKLRILQDYILEYLRIVCSNRKRERFSLTLVDGFAGGGKYEDGTFGSPIAMWNAVQEAQEEINERGGKPITIDPYFVFVDNNPYNIQSLRETLEEKNIPQDVYDIHEGEFAACYSSKIKPLVETRHPGKGLGMLFFLDQCGYKDVPIEILRDIKHSFPKSEAIINIAIQRIIDHINDSDAFRKGLISLKIPNQLVAELMDTKESKGLEFRHFAEAKIAKAIKGSAGFEFFTPYYIEPYGNHRGYWLLHLAQNHRAHNAMMDVIWRNGNEIRHYGEAGYGITAMYKKGDSIVRPNFLGQVFNDVAYKAHQEKLQEQIPVLLRKQSIDRITFEDLVRSTCNDTAANIQMYGDVITNGIGIDFTVRGPGGGKKRSDTISNSDIIIPIRSGILDFGESKK